MNVLGWPRIYLADCASKIYVCVNAINCIETQENLQLLLQVTWCVTQAGSGFIKSGQESHFNPFRLTGNTSVPIAPRQSKRSIKQHTGQFLTACILNKNIHQRSTQQKAWRRTPEVFKVGIKGNIKQVAAFSFVPQNAENNAEPVKIPNVLLYTDCFSVPIREWLTLVWGSVSHVPAEGRKTLLNGVLSPL